jgi:hypothetical protein
MKHFYAEKKLKLNLKPPRMAQRDANNEDCTRLNLADTHSLDHLCAEVNESTFPEIRTGWMT